MAISEECAKLLCFMRESTLFRGECWKTPPECLGVVEDPKVRDGSAQERNVPKAAVSK